MSWSVEMVLKEALLLRDDARAELVVQLLDSLPPPGSTDAWSDEEWIAEVERRARIALAGSPGAGLGGSARTHRQASHGYVEAYSRRQPGS